KRITPDTGMTLGMIIHAGVWSPIGAVAGLALGVGLGGPRAIALALLGGLAGAVLGTMGYEVASALLYPQARLDHPIPEERGLRLLAVFGIAVLTALGAGLGVGERRAKKPIDPDLA